MGHLLTHGTLMIFIYQEQTSKDKVPTASSAGHVFEEKGTSTFSRSSYISNVCFHTVAFRAPCVLDKHCTNTSHPCFCPSWDVKVGNWDGNERKISWLWAPWKKGLTSRRQRKPGESKQCIPKSITHSLSCLVSPFATDPLHMRRPFLLGFC